MSLTKIVGVGFVGSLGFTFLVLGSVLSGKWYSLLMFLFYGFTPLPLLFVRNDGYESFDGTSINKSLDVAIFFVAGMVVSTFAFPILLSLVPPEDPAMSTTNAFFAEMATLMFYVTAGLFAVASREEEAF